MLIQFVGAQINNCTARGRVPTAQNMRENKTIDTQDAIQEGYKFRYKYCILRYCYLTCGRSFDWKKRDLAPRSDLDGDIRENLG
jgi:hypothetical protein